MIAVGTKLFGKLADAVSAVLFFTAFAMFVIAVFFRYVMNQPITWSEEFISMVFVWMLFWTLGLSVTLKKQISFGIVYDLFPPQGKRVLAFVSILIAGTIFVLALPGTFDFLQWVTRERTAALGISRGFTYASFGLFMVSVPLRLAGWGVSLLTPNWRDHV